MDTIDIDRLLSNEPTVRGRPVAAHRDYGQRSIQRRRIADAKQVRWGLSVNNLISTAEGRHWLRRTNSEIWARRLSASYCKDSGCMNSTC